MEEITTKRKISQEFRIELKTRIQNMITGQRELLALPQDNLISEEVKDRSKIDSAQAITKINREINRLEKALMRVDGQNYGTCVDCDNEIPLARLKADPTTMRCTTCAAKHEKRN
jgi:DnaK suppressor protein